MKPTKTYLDLAFKTLDVIEPILRKHFGKPDHVQKKSDGTLVTEIDPKIEKMVREMIRTAFPDHGIIGEELASENPESDFQWIIDPLDGTLDYIHGIPDYGSIIALFYKGEPLVGIIGCPETADRYHAIQGQGAFWKDQTLQLSDLKKEDIPKQIISLSYRNGYVKSGYQEAYDRLFGLHPEVTTVPNCYGHGLVARGSLATMANFNISLWDIATTKLLIEEAGGAFVFQKRRDEEGGSKYDVIFGKPTAVNWLVDHFKIHPSNTLMD